MSNLDTRLHWFEVLAVLAVIAAFFMLGLGIGQTFGACK